MEKKFELKEQGLELSIGRFARQTDGSAWLKRKGTVVLSTAVSAESAEFPGFFPLSVDYRKYRVVILKEKADLQIKKYWFLD